MLGNWNTRRGPRIGIMLHYDASTSDDGGIAWLTQDPRCTLSYNAAIRDNGVIVPVAPEEARAWHAGVCRPSRPELVYTDANSAFYGIAITAKAGDEVTSKQLESVVRECARLFKKNGWPASETWRITSHAAEAWPRGRKVDCEGPRPDRPVLDPDAVRRALADAA